MSTERIGKLTLDLSAYGGQDLYCDGAVEDELLEIVKTRAASDYAAAIKEKPSWPLLYHLSELRENIVSWIDIPEGAKILEVGSGCGAISGVLSQKAGEAGHLDCVELSKKRSLINAYRHKNLENICIHVGNFEDIEPTLPADYDAIFLIGVFEYAASYIHDKDPYGSFLNIIKRHVKTGGRIVIAIENRLGLKYFGGAREDHLGDYFSGIEDYPNGGVVRTFSKPALEKLFSEAGFGKASFYYPYPDYKFVNTIYSDERLPREGELSINHLKLDRDRYELFNEQSAYDSLIRDGLYPVFSNSFLIVLGPKPEVIYSKYSNDRAARCAIRTDILQNEAGERSVRKLPMQAEAREHIAHIESAYKELSGRYAGSELKICPARMQDPAAEFPYLKGDTMEELLERALKRGDRNEALKLLKLYGEFVYYNAKSGADNRDMLFSNLIKTKDGWILIDYEWEESAPGDARENLIRALYLFKEYNAGGKLLDAELIRAAFPGIEPEFDMPALWAKERAFQKTIIGGRLALGEWNEVFNNAAHKLGEANAPQSTAPVDAAAEQKKSGLKQAVQDRLRTKALAAYQKELASQQSPYRLPCHGGIEVKAASRLSQCSIIPYSEAGAASIEGDTPYIIFAEDGGRISKKEVQRIEEYFAKESSCLWLYTDEDRIDENGSCRYPHYKPDYSADTLLSSFYIGGMFAARRGAAGAALAAMKQEQAESSGLPFLYMLALLLSDAEPPAHIREVLYHRFAEGISTADDGTLLADAPASGEDYIPLKEAYLSRHKINARFELDGDGCAYPIYALPKGRLSILILSKDHSALLKNCVRSIREKASFDDYEIVVVDNGSSAAERERYEALAREYDLRYFYHEAEFNFSALCNYAAQEAFGSWLLFLNDDTELITPDAFERMLGAAAQPGVSAVGAKLYYPGGKLIQHCGVQNVSGGPMHRLSGFDDAHSYYYGCNRGARNVMAATAACLLISKKTFNEAGGFCEDLPVAYNDVDLCLRLNAAGGRIVLRNDVRFIHHESLSRGDDKEDADKRARIADELAKLYARDPAHAAHDPYDHDSLSVESNGYVPAHPYEDRLLPVADTVEQLAKKRFEPVNEALIITKEAGAKTERRDGSVLISLLVHVRGWDNAHYRFSLYAEGASGIYRLPALRRYRPDAARVNYEQQHVELSGLAVRLAPGALPSGRYTLWVEAKSLISRQRLFRSVPDPLDMT